MSWPGDSLFCISGQHSKSQKKKAPFNSQGVKGGLNVQSPLLYLVESGNLRASTSSPGGPAGSSPSCVSCLSFTLGRSGHFPLQRSRPKPFFFCAHSMDRHSLITTHCARKPRCKWLCHCEAGCHRTDSHTWGSHAANPLPSPCK